MLFVGIIIVTFFLMEGVAWAAHKYIMHGFLWHLHEDHHTCLLYTSPSPRD